MFVLQDIYFESTKEVLAKVGKKSVELTGKSLSGVGSVFKGAGSAFDYVGKKLSAKDEDTKQ